MAMEKQFQELTLKQKKLKIQFPRRPGLGTLGKKVLVRANYVKLVKFPNSKLFRYNFDVLTSTGRKPSRTVRGKILLEMIKQKKFGDCIPIYDWNDLIYCSKELPIGKGNDTKIEFILPPNEEDGHKKPTKFTVTIKSGREINLQALNNYITLGTRPDDNDDDDDDVQTCMSALNAFLSYKVRTSFLSVGRGVYPSVSDDRRIILNTGEELRKGFRQSLRIGWDNLLVNVDTSSAILFPPGNILDVIAGFFGCHRNDLKDGIKEEDRKFLHKILKGVKVYVTHRGSEKKRKFTIDGLTSEPANRLKFKNQEDREMTISEYFKETYKPLEFGKLPCIIFKQKCFLPLEVCVLLPDQPYKGNLSEDARAEMIKHTCVKPAERFRTIDDSFRNFFQFDQNEHLKSIGMNIDINTKVKAESRILPSPSLTFHKDSKQPTHVVEGGRWNYVNRKILEGQTLVNWSVLVLSNDNQEAVEGFMRTFREILNTKGMNIVNNPQIMKFSAQRNIKEGLVQAVQKAQINKQAPPQLVVVVMRDRSPIYNDIKRIGETDLGVRTQCMLSRHLRKRQEQYCVNLGLKINAKLGGKNFSLSPGQIDFISSVPTMVFGADVFHSGRTEQQVPSIAAVCASMDPAATVYSGRHSVNQKPRNETIENLEGMVVDLLKAFQNRNKRLPQRILFYRDGVSEGQFKKVIVEEVEAMKRAFKRGYGDKPPKLTFVIVQKRHNTRLVPEVPRDADRNGNCKSGTVIDTVIVSKHEFDFFLQSHASLQGTARSAHYRVLVDENGFNADSMQSLTNKLCYLNARCTSAISIVTPAFYAHLIANRARIYLTWDGKSSSDGGTYSCPDVKKGMENIMYFI